MPLTVTQFCMQDNTLLSGVIAMEDDILELFHEEQNSFTIFVVEIQFATGRGLEYFRKFKGKENYIDSNFLAENTLQRPAAENSSSLPPP